MKHKIYILTLAATLLAVGCSDDNDSPVVKRDSVPIAFAGDMKAEEAVTRAGGEEVSLTEYSNQFVVAGYKNTPADGLKDVMKGYTVRWAANTAGSTVSNTTDWEYVGIATDQDVKHWDFAATDYRFFAYVPSRGDNRKGANPYNYSVSTSDVSDGKVAITFSNLESATSYNDGVYVGPKSEGHTISVYDLPLYSDFWCKSPLDPEVRNETTQKMAPVKLAFRMPFARVKIMFKRSANSAVYAADATVTNIKFAPILTETTQHRLIKKANFVVTYPLTPEAGSELTTTVVVATGSETMAEMTFDDMKKGEPGSYKGILDKVEHPYAASPEYFMFPRKGEHTDFKLSASIGNILQECIVPAELMEWEPGYEYTYIFKILESGGIHLDLIGVGISQWEYVEEPFVHEVHNW